MDNFDYKLGTLNGILTGLSYVNNKANHGYTFEITKIDASKPLEIATENYLKGFYKDATVSFSEVIDWRSEINAALHTWLFPISNLQHRAVAAQLLLLLRMSITPFQCP